MTYLPSLVAAAPDYLTGGCHVFVPRLVSLGETGTKKKGGGGAENILAASQIVFVNKSIEHRIQPSEHLLYRVRLCV